MATTTAPPPAVDPIRESMTATAEHHDIGITVPELELLITAATTAADRYPRHDTPAPRRPRQRTVYGTPLKAGELDVICGLARGHEISQIASQLHLAPATVKSRLRSIGKRTGVHDQAGIVGVAYSRGWLAHLPPEPRDATVLHHREAEVLQGMAEGLSNPEIGRRLFLSEYTVKTYAQRLLKSLQAVSRTHAVALGYQHHHLTPVTPEQPGATT